MGGECAQACSERAEAARPVQRERGGSMTRAEPPSFTEMLADIRQHHTLSEIAQYLENAVDMYTATHFDPKTRRVQPKEMRDEIAQLLKWIKLLREET
jgi:hypothetical protein